MLALALVGLLAAPAPANDALPRVPGMRLRLGMEESAVLALGSFAEAKVQDAGTMTARQGAARFFGVPGEATCYMDGGRLARVRFEATGVSRHSLDYVDGQLRRALLDRRCTRDVSGDRECDWVGPTLTVSTEMKQDRLVARIEPSTAPGESLADSPPGRAARPGAVTKPPARSPTRSAPTATTPAAGRATAGARDTAPADRPPARTGTASGPAVAAVVMHPETLTISLASHNSPDVWPRIVSALPLDYPARARSESIQGIVWVVALVEPDGRVSDAWIERSILELDTAALSWVSRSRFAPGEWKGRPCRFHVRVAVRFTLY